MIFAKRLGALLLISALAGCASSPRAQFLTLTAVDPNGAAASAVKIPVQVAAVHVPAALDRREMVSRSADDTVQISDTHRWAAPLGQMARRTLTQDLSRRLLQGSVILPQQPAPKNAYRVVVDILQFDRNAAGKVVFDGSWSLLRGESDHPVLSRHLHLSEQADSNDYGGQARAMSDILGSVADAIAVGVTDAEGSVATSARSS